MSFLPRIAEEATEEARKRLATRAPAIIGGLRASELRDDAILARTVERMAERSKPPKLVELRPMGRGFAIRAHCGCGCGAVVRAVYALTVPAAAWRFRFARREAQLVEEALG